MKIDERNMDGLFEEADIVCEAFDKAEAKALQAYDIREYLPHKYLISGSGMAGTGPAHEMVTKRITSHFFICGDGRSDVDENEALLGTRVMLCAAQQAHQVLRIIAGEE
jgi:sulfur carrier protein ThiS adenylyltransferase